MAIQINEENKKTKANPVMWLKLNPQMWWVIYCINPLYHAIKLIVWWYIHKRDGIIPHSTTIYRHSDTDSSTDADGSHLPSWGNNHGNHVVWSAPATATFTDPGGLRAVMSHFGEVKAPSTLTCSNAQIMGLSNPEIMNEVFPLPHRCRWYVQEQTWITWVTLRFIKVMKNTEDKTCEE